MVGEVFSRNRAVAIKVSTVFYSPGYDKAIVSLLATCCEHTLRSNSISKIWHLEEKKGLPLSDYRFFARLSSRSRRINNERWRRRARASASCPSAGLSRQSWGKQGPLKLVRPRGRWLLLLLLLLLLAKAPFTAKCSFVLLSQSNRITSGKQTELLKRIKQKLHRVQIVPYRGRRIEENTHAAYYQPDDDFAVLSSLVSYQPLVLTIAWADTVLRKTNAIIINRTTWISCHVSA